MDKKDQPKNIDFKQALKERFGAHEPEKKPEKPKKNIKTAQQHSSRSNRHNDNSRLTDGDKSTFVNYYLPVDSLPILKPLLGLKQQHIDNFALLLNKCALYDSKQQKFLLSRQAKNKSGQRGGEEDYAITPKFSPDLLKQIHQRHAAAIRALHLAGTDAALTFTVDWRLIVGLGNESVYETSMTLHHIYGIPYIPGQAVKGVLRSCIILDRFKGIEGEALKDYGFCDIFGCSAESIYGEAHQGNAYFFDAFPTRLDKDSIQPDIMNPHYGPYYSEGKPPADYHNPVPVTFLTVKDITFEFFVGIKHNDNDVFKQGEFAGKTPLQIIQNALKDALTQHGLGAKTAVGYGYFTHE